MAISAENICFAYYTKPVLSNISLNISSGKFSILLGRNGSGKSTLLKILAGLLDPNTGTIRVFGNDIQTLTLRQRAKFIGFLPQFHRCVFPFSVFDVVLTGRAGYVRFLPNDEDKQNALESLERVGVMHLKDRSFTELSGGEQQLVMIARVLAQNPRIILLDEPTSHLDFFYQTRMMNLIKTFVNQGMTVIAVLHDPNTAFWYGDEFFFLKHGQIQSVNNSENKWDESVLEYIYDTQFQTVMVDEKPLVVPKTDNCCTSIKQNKVF